MIVHGRDVESGTGLVREIEAVVTGNYYRRTERRRPPEAQAYDEETRARRDSLSRDLTGLPPADGS